MRLPYLAAGSPDARIGAGWQPRRSDRGGLAAGFTLVELMVVIAIFLTTFTLLLAGFRASRPKDIVRTAAAMFATDVQSVVTAALAGDPDHPQATVFGILLDTAAPDTYTVFVDQLACTGTTCVPATVTVDGAPLPPAAIVRVVEFPDHTVLAGIAPQESGRVAIVALYPRADLRLFPDTAATEARVTIGTDLGDATKTVTVNRISGRVDVE